MFRKRVIPCLVVAGLCVPLLAEATWFRWTTSITFDETYYLNCALQTVHDRWLDRRIAAEGIGPLPIMLTYVPALLFAPRESRPEPWVGHRNDAELIAGPRLANALVSGVPLAAIVFAWLFRRRGMAAAIFGAGMLVLSPTIVAHCALATTEAAFALFGTLAVAATAWYLHAPSRWRLAHWAAAIAAAMTAKYSAVFLLPAAALLLLFRRLPSSGGVRKHISAVRQATVTFAGLLCLIVPIWWGLHLFTFTGPLKNVGLEDTPDSSPYVRLLGRGPAATWFMDVAHRQLKRPAPVAGIMFQYLHNETGHDCFLMGDRSRTGWWYYFPCAFVFKSTPPELALTAMMAVSLLLSLRAPWASFRGADPTLQTLLVATGVFVAFVLTSRINIGHRYLVLLYPLLMIAASDRLAVWLRAWPRSFALLGGLLLAGQLASNLAIAPHFLAYFNRLCGGPERGGRLLVDSNIDWGQDLPALRRELARSGGGAVALQYFGTALPEAYGIAADRVEQLSRPLETYHTLAISVSCLQGLYVPEGDPFRDFRAIPPDGRAGYSIVTYRLDSPEKQAALRTAVDTIRQAAERPKRPPGGQE